MKELETLPDSFHELIRPLAIATLRDVGPDDIPIIESSFQELLTATTGVPVAVPGATLAFGAQDLVLLAPPAVLLAKEAVLFLWKESKTAVITELVEHLRRRLRGVLADPSTRKPSPLSKEQLRRLERVLIRESKRYGLPVEVSRSITDATIRALVV